MKLGAMATVVTAVSTMAVGGQAEAQAVQWKVSDGGNGHWYQLRTLASPANWTASRQLAESCGGYLATPTSAGEDQFIRSTLLEGVIPVGQFGPHIGAFRLDGTAQQAPCPGWQWISGEPFSYIQNDLSTDLCQIWSQFYAYETRLQYWVGEYLVWNNCDDSTAVSSLLVEWSADCNNDGIVDYGQCRDGSLPDYNGNSIPDCCEQGTPCVVGNYPVQWRVEDGGNGHWYQAVSAPSTWFQAQTGASQRHGYLATPLSNAENLFVFGISRQVWSGQQSGVGQAGPWIGGRQAPAATEPAGGWGWATGEAWAYTNWGCSQPDNYDDGPESALDFSTGFLCGGGVAPTWNDAPPSRVDPGYLIEWSADCNTDGIVDYGQILLGHLDDLDANGMPDSCESLRVPQNYPTIQAAIDSVSAGTHKLISVAAGTYHESFSLNGKDVLVRGAANNATILDGTGLATSIAHFTGNEPATAGVESLVFRNGTAGSRVFPKATFTVGGAIYGLNSSAFIRNCRFEQNEADFGGAVYLLHCDAAVEGCVFAGNEALADGGGFLAYECAGAVRTSDFIANSCGASGSGNGGAFKTVGARTAGGVFLLEGCTVSGTSSGVDGGAVHHFENLVLGIAGGLRIEDTEISGNTSVVGAGGVRHDGRQPALVLAGSTVVCTNLVRNIEGAYLIEGAATACDCLADLTGDGAVNGADLGIALNAWGVADALGTGDVNHDGLVNGVDLGIMLSAWGACH